MEEIINWHYFEFYQLQNKKLYLLAYHPLNAPKKITTGIFYYRENKWFDDEGDKEYHYLEKDNVIEYIAEAPKGNCKR